MKARAGVSLAIVTTVEVEVEFELQVQLLLQFEGGGIKGGDKPSKGGGQTA